MSAYVIIPPQTTAFTSPQFPVGPGTDAFLTANGLGAGEGIVVQVWDTCMANWYDLKLDGVLQALDSNTNVLGLIGSGTYRLVKSVTVAAVGANLER